MRGYRGNWIEKGSIMDKTTSTRKRPLRAALAAVVFGGLGLGTMSACSTPQEPTPVARTAADDSRPETGETAGPPPSEVLKDYKLHSPPKLSKAADVAAFIDWAAASHVDEAEDVQKVMAGVARNKEVLAALIAEVERVQTTDHPRAVIALGLLGETRSADAQAFFTAFVRRPLPDKGTEIEGEIVEQTLAAQLQGKAIDGLAFINSDSSNKVVTEVAGRHESRIVRAEAINAYLWNHGDSDEARARLAQVVRRDELVLIDRVRRDTGEKADTFDAKLDEFLKKHPELEAPKPEQGKDEPKPEDPDKGDEPPVF